MTNTQKILRRIKEQGKSQKEIADVLGIARCSVSLKINNKRPFSIDEACRLAEFLNIPDTEFSSYFFEKEAV